MAKNGSKPIYYIKKFLELLFNSLKLNLKISIEK